MSLPAILRSPWNLSDPLLWVALAALAAAWVQVSEGRGTGLGLVIAQAGASSCGGALSFEPNTPRGTRAIIDLPRTEVPHG